MLPLHLQGRTFHRTTLLRAPNLSSSWVSDCSHFLLEVPPVGPWQNSDYSRRSPSDVVS